MSRRTKIFGGIAALGWSGVWVWSYLILRHFRALEKVAQNDPAMLPPDGPYRWIPTHIIAEPPLALWFLFLVSAIAAACVVISVLIDLRTRNHHQTGAQVNNA